MYAEVVLNIPLNKTFHYIIPAHIDAASLKGKRVKVPPLGASAKIKHQLFLPDVNSGVARAITGYVINVTGNADPALEYKPLISVIDEEPIFNEESLLLSKWLCENYVCSLGEALSAVVPVSMKPSSQKRKSTQKKYSQNPKHTLNAAQLNAQTRINAAIEKGTFSPFLLHGVTGSGKTEVYLNAIETALKHGRSAVMLIPEISLTAQFVEIVKGRFGSACGVWHSHVTSVQKYKLYKGALSGEIKIMIGARSAVFAPFKNVGVIIVDEEHEKTYKQEDKPSYDARETAFWRAKFHNAAVVLGSATPSLESYAKCENGSVELIELPERVDKKQMPEVKIISTKGRFLKNGSLFLPESIEAISKALVRREQVIVFLNRRGHSPQVACKSCGNVYQCKDCSISMVYHKNPEHLKCHYCGSTKKMNITCPICKGKEFQVFGTGTQKVEMELKTVFPHAKIFRLDGDTATNKTVYEKAYRGLKDENYDILLGTQMIAKGFDFPNVTLVVVADADTSLYLPDFTSASRTFELITQVAGRAGRGDRRGKVIVQTSNPDHYALAHASRHDYKNFQKEENRIREKFNYPPYVDLAKLTLRNVKEDKAAEDADVLCEHLTKFAKTKNLPVKFIGPSEAYIAKLHNTYRYNIVLKGAKDDILKVCAEIQNFKPSSGTVISTEISPSSLV
jgi:primosomal protein N' (replication factor Y)